MSETSMYLEAQFASHARSGTEWVPPQEFDLTTTAGEQALVAAFDQNKIRTVVDRTDEIAAELFEVRHPNQTGNDAVKAEFVENIKAQGAKYGRWFLFSWDEELVHYPPVEDYREIRTNRDEGLVTPQKRDRLYKAAVAVFGLSVGSNVLRELAIAGIGGKLIFGDRDRISPTNLNRINGGLPDVGTRKLDHAAMKISALDPYVEQVHFAEGVTSDNIHQLDEHVPNVIFDEVDDIRAKAVMRAYAAETGTPLVMVTDLGENTVIDVERYDHGDAEPFGGRVSKATFDRLVNGTATPEEIERAKLSIVGLRYIPPRMLQAYMNVGNTLAGVPQLGNTASKGGALGALVAKEIILGGQMRTGRYVDPPRRTLGLGHDMSFREAAGTYVDFAQAVVRKARAKNSSPETKDPAGAAA